jgi:hypothetical protein
MLRPAKNDLGLKVPGMYEILCECGKVYVEQTGRFTEARHKEYIRHICLEQPKKSAVVKKSINTGHCRLQQYFYVAQGSRIDGPPCKRSN